MLQTLIMKNRFWYGHVLRKEDENVKVKALKFELRDSKGKENRNKRGKSK